MNTFHFNPFMPDFFKYIKKFNILFKLMLNEMEIVNLTIGHKININLDVNLNCLTRKQCLQKVHRYKLNMHKLVFGGIKVLFQFKF